MMHDHSQKFILVHFHNLSRRQCLRNQNHRFVPKINTDGCTTQYLDQTVGNLLHIIDSSSNDRLFQMSECLNQFISVDHNCISSIYLFIGNAAFNCILVTSDSRSLIWRRKTPASCSFRSLLLHTAHEVSEPPEAGLPENY